MKTLRALFWGAIVGAIAGYLFAPRHTDILRAEQREGGTAPTGEAPTGATRTATRMSGAASAPVGAASTATGRYVGNTHTRVYHEQGDANLPEEDNRTYFESAAAAEAAGYRPAGRVSTAI